ncbi:NAD(P)-dependent oxidoreductase [Cognatishimia sp. SS12]|uniref:NAD-dependent epimerase/dehydratase family protein n=1 Tax=Cognatishimia sp. SS12 TaxID=2979465 RepID=UPI00232E49AC|nr:NAD(P)-dependent oxidoreductase [Cognatishimia sp. SS12]MDC0739686.1 NAD(P)-dependent oxidoreductase [Cognatishimia sp. SS12]
MAKYKKITVIGGSGFVGTNFCQRLVDHQIDFEIIDIKQSQRFPEKCKTGDVRDIVSLREAISGDVVVNLAAVHRDDVRDKAEYFHTNVAGAENVAKICTEKCINKIVFTSTVAVYGFADPKTDESGKINPFNEYGITKFQAEEKLRHWKNSGDNSLVIVRPTVIFGEGNRGNVFNLLNQIYSGKFLMIGGGENKKSMAYIGNITAFLQTCLSSEKDYAVYNYVDTPDLTMNELVGLVRDKLLGKHGAGLRLPYWFGLLIGYIADCVTKVTGKNFPISSIRVKKFVAFTQFCSAKNDLEGFEAPFTLSEGIHNTLHSEFLAPDPNREIFFTE